ncbi:MAG TPA: LysM domain-containing protein, partial [Gemmatimonadaceae bacterium]|nr:LysM domain-containing protein [Gemmatimonadaceae bacterium]
MAAIIHKYHVVRRGESLASIAATHGLASWKALYDAPANKDLRRLRPNPRFIQPGDRVAIPPDARELARAQLTQLRQLRADAEQVFDQLARELQREKARLAQLGKNVDTAATFATMFAGVGKTVYEGIRNSARIVGDVAAVEGKMAWTHVGLHYVATGDFVLGQVKDAPRQIKNPYSGERQSVGLTEIVGDEAPLAYVAKQTVNVYYSLTSPSYWADRATELWTGKTTGDVFAEAE